MEIKSDMVILCGSASDVYGCLSNPRALGDVLDFMLEKARNEGRELPADLEQSLDKVTFDIDGITFPAGSAGVMTLRLGQCTPDTRIEYTGANSPLPLSLIFNLIPLGEGNCEAEVTFRADVPVFVRPMIQNPMKKAVNMFSDILCKIPSWK